MSDGLGKYPVHSRQASAKIYPTLMLDEGIFPLKTLYSLPISIWNNFSFWAKLVPVFTITLLYKFTCKAGHPEEPQWHAGFRYPALQGRYLHNIQPLFITFLSLQVHKDHKSPKDMESILWLQCHQEPSKHDSAAAQVLAAFTDSSQAHGKKKIIQH